MQTVDGSTIGLCLYLQCLSGDPEVTCNTGTTPDTSHDARPGCCATGTTEIAPDLNCTSTTDETALVFMRVYDPSGAAVCTEYTLSWHY